MSQEERIGLSNASPSWGTVARPRGSRPGPPWRRGRQRTSSTKRIRPTRPPATTSRTGSRRQSSTRRPPTTTSPARRERAVGEAHPPLPLVRNRTNKAILRETSAPKGRFARLVVVDLTGRDITVTSRMTHDLPQVTVGDHGLAGARDVPDLEEKAERARTFTVSRLHVRLLLRLAHATSDAAGSSRPAHSARRSRWSCQATLSARSSANRAAQSTSSS